MACSFQEKQINPLGQEVVQCLLPAGVCPIQVQQEGLDGKPLITCSQPHCVLVDWQVVMLEKLPTEEVGRFMTPDPVTAQPATPLKSLAQMMMDADLQQIFVVDEQRRPVGFVSRTDLLALLARIKTESSDRNGQTLVEERGGPMQARSVCYGADTTWHESNDWHHRLIERRAYARWRAKGCPGGTALQDWLEAEAEVALELRREANPYLCDSRGTVEIAPQ
jgi:hypothetical protein